MAPRLSLKEEPQRPEREQLQMASQRHVALQRHFKAFGDAGAKIWGDIQNATRDVERIEKEIGRAKSAGSNHRVAQALGEDAPAPPSVSDLRAQLFDARATLDELKSAQQKLMLDEAEIAAQLDVSNIHLRECVCAVVKSDPRTRELVAHLEAARSRFVSLNQAVSFLVSNGMMPDQSPHAVEPTNEIENLWRQTCIALMAGDIDVLLPSTNPDLKG
jgi:hypothetical protein